MGQEVGFPSTEDGKTMGDHVLEGGQKEWAFLAQKTENLLENIIWEEGKRIGISGVQKMEYILRIIKPTAKQHNVQ
jgi:hypothetical protein